MWFTRLAIARPILIWMALLAIAVLGFQAYTRLPAELNPRVDIPTLTVTTIYPGAGPPEIEAQITKPLEEAVGTVAGVRDVYSSSQANVSVISINFLVGTNLDVAVADVRGRVEAIRSQLPPDAQAPIVAKLDINALPILYYGFTSPTLNLEQLRDLADDTLRPRLERVPGVASVRVIGGEQREVQVSVDGAKLAQFGITIADVINSLKAAGRDIPGGGISSGTRETDVRLAGAYTSLDALRNTQILAPQLQQAQAMGRQYRPSDALDAPALTVGDVATVTEGNAERREITRINGRDGIGLVFTKSGDANTVTVSEAVKRALAELQPSLPPDLERVTLRDDAATVGAALEDVNITLILGALLAMAVILLFLHNLRGTFIVSLAIPSCIVATFLVMWVAGFTLNQMTLLALSLSVGILVDDSIVVLESITRHLQNGETPREAAFNGRTEIGFADITTTLVDVVVFVPIGFMGGIVGGFFQQFGLTIAAATLFSLVVSFSVTPMLAARWYKTGEDLEAKRGPYAVFERLYRALEHRYRGVIRWALGHRGLVLGAGVASLVLIFLLSFNKLGFEFLPGTDQGQISVNIEMPPGTSLAGTDAAARQVETIVMQTPDVAATVTNVGQVLGGFGSIPQQGAQFAQINVRLKPRGGWFGTEDGRRRSDEEIAVALRQRLSGLLTESGGRVHVAAIRNVQGIATPVQLEIRGPDLERLTAFASQVRDRISHVPGIIDPDVSARSGKPELRVEIDRLRAAQFNIPIAQAGSILRDSIAGNTEIVLRREGEEIPVRTRLRLPQRDDPDEVRNIVVGSDGQGQPVTLADIANLNLRSGPTIISRTNGQRMVSVTANLEPGVPLGNVQQIIDREIAQIPHEGITVEWGGDAKTMEENIPYFVSALGMAIILVYIVMAALFNSLGTPFVIMFTLPMALIGALGALVVMGETMSLVAGIGIIMLIGLMGRNAILLLDYVNTLRARGMERQAAIQEAGATRLRPILMTTTATIVGMLPVALRFGEAAEVRAPMAIVVIGGLLVSTLLTLVVIPVLYTLFDDWFRIGGGPRASAAAPPASPPHPPPPAPRNGREENANGAESPGEAQQTQERTVKRK